MSDERTKQDWANYRRFVHHKNALNMIFNYAPPSQCRRPVRHRARRRRGGRERDRLPERAESMS